ncbi:MAG: helix-turn-helix domain-containing protein [Alkalibacterium sp.]|nr:helix-turn-helix domain-containing protein [Alkalibacterium sp.]
MNEIGEKLKEARQAKGYTLDDLQQMTKIQKRYLVAVEEGNHDVLPGNFYARAFIKQYADSVGLNGEELINSHMDSLPQVNETTYSKNVQSTQTRSKTKSSGFLATIQDSLPTILIVLLVVAIIFAIYFAVTRGGANGDSDSFIQGDDSSEIVEVDNNEELEDDEETDEESDETDSETDVEEEQDDENDEVDNEEQSVEEVEGSNNSTTYQVSGAHPDEQTIVLTAVDGDTWVSIAIDGEPDSQALLTDGQTLQADFDDQVENVTLIIGNASATEVELNNQPLPYGEAATESVRQEMYIIFE